MSLAAAVLPGVNGNKAALAKGPKLPNIVLIFTDDQGYADVGVFGAEGFKTPNHDKLAAEGMKFTDFHVSQAVCSASRAALMTGCYSNRVSILGALNPAAKHGINADETIIPEMLKQKGYATGMVGKWHLGHHKKFLPLQHGFDEYLGIPYSNDMWPVDFDGTPATRGNKIRYPVLPLIEDNETVAEIKTLADQDTITTRYTERAVKFIKANKDKPFFLYMAHSMPHIPLGVSAKFRGKSQQGLYGDVMMEIDWSTGQIMAALKDSGIDDNTLVIFTTDNGPWLNFGNHAGSAKPLREGKGTMFEGGARTPCIMRWPGVIPAGTTCAKLTATLDILPTLAEITGAKLPKNKIDGISILPLLKGDKTAEPRKEFYYYYGNQLQCVRQGPWKLILPHKHRSYLGVQPGKDGFPGPYAQGKIELSLYNLDTDIEEKNNVIDKYPEIVAKLQKLAETARNQLGDGLKRMKGTEIRPAGQL
ncbi:MAG: sulfatase [Phycisphaerae bacterium]|nr:sulfatase [Phycisphaerae bacterium]